MSFIPLFGKNEENTFPYNEIPNILGFNIIHDGSVYQIGYKMLDTFENLTMADDEEKIFLAIILFICLQGSNFYLN